MDEMNDEFVIDSKSLSALEEALNTSSDYDMDNWIGPSEEDQQDHDEYQLSRQLEEDFFFPDIPDYYE